MKKFNLLLAVLLIVTLCSCGTKNTNDNKSNSTVSEITSNAEISDTAIETAIKETFDRNVKCMVDIFKVKTLEYDQTPIKDTYCVVKSDEFKTFDELKNYVEKTYTGDLAKNILENQGDTGKPLYLDVDGKLCIDSSLVAGRGYNVSWDNYTLETTKVSDTEYKYKATASYTEPGEDVTPEPYVKEGTVVLENGNWLLKETVF